MKWYFLVYKLEKNVFTSQLEFINTQIRFQDVSTWKSELVDPTNTTQKHVHLKMWTSKSINTISKSVYVIIWGVSFKKILFLFDPVERLWFLFFFKFFTKKCFFSLHEFFLFSCWGIYIFLIWLKYKYLGRNLCWKY